MGSMIETPLETALSSENPITGDQLKIIRTRLGLTYGAMASLLYVAPGTYKRWEEEGTSPRIWAKLKNRLTSFHASATTQLALLDESGVDLTDYLPIHLASAQLGIPQEVLFHRHRAGKLRAMDLGVLGLWIHREDLERD